MIRNVLISFLQELEVEIVSRTPNSGGYIPCRCPLAEWLHERGRDGNASFFAKVEEDGTSHWHCFTCKRKGARVSSLVRQLGYFREEDYGNLAIRADLAEIPTEFGSYEGDEELAPPPQPLDRNVFDGMFPDAWEEVASREYLQRRGVGKSTAAMLELVFDPEEQRVLFPIMDRDKQLFGFSGRSILPKEKITDKYPRHRDYNFKKERFLLGEHLYQKGKPIWLVEGLFGLAHMVEIGAMGSVTPMAPMMSSVSKFQQERLVDFNESVYLCFDPDKAGDQGLFGPLGNDCKFKGGGAIDRIKQELPVFLPMFDESRKDVDDILPNEFQTMFMEAELQ